jgi:hypothetical protein
MNQMHQLVNLCDEACRVVQTGRFLGQMLHLYDTNNNDMGTLSLYFYILLSLETPDYPLNKVKI